ncbi:MAG: DUF4397 domain-containing protein [Ferruginibacter sp.]
MKTNLFLRILLPLGSIFLFLGCEKNDDPTQAGTAKVAVVHAAAGVGAIDVLLNGTQVNTTGISFGSASGVMGNPYFTVTSGINNLRINTAGNTLFQSNFLANANTNYSVFAYDTLGTGAGSAALLMSDVILALGSDTAQVRLLHLSHNAGAIDIEFIQPGSITLVADSVTFIGSNPNSVLLSKFQKIRSGDYTFNIKINGTSILILTANINIANGKSYTFYVNGSRSAGVASPFAFGFGQLLHN